MRYRQRARGLAKNSDGLCCGKIRNMNDQRVETWPALRGINRCDCCAAGCIARESVYRFGRHRDDIARLDQRRRFGNCGASVRADAGLK